MADDNRIVVNELLASTVHAIATAKLTKEIIVVFLGFYDAALVNGAKSILMDVELIPRRSTRNTGKDAREKDLLEIIDCIRKTDWKGINVKFAAVDLTHVCNVPSALGDELSLRAEMTNLKRKFEDLTSCYNEIKSISDQVEHITETIQDQLQNKREPLPNISTQLVSIRPEKLDIQIPTLIGERTADGTSRPETPLYSQIMARAYNNSQGQISTTADKTQEGYTLVTHKKPRRKSKAVTGKISGSQISVGQKTAWYIIHHKVLVRNQRRTSYFAR